VEELHGVWKNARDKHEHPILVYGIDPHDPVFLIPEVAEQQVRLKLPDTALIDSRSKDFYGDRGPGSTAELAHHAVQVVGTFPLGPDFRADGNLIVSTRTFFKCFASSRTAASAAAKVEVGLLKVTPGADVLAVRASLQEALPGDVRILTKQEFIDQVATFWATSKPAGKLFGLGMLVGFFIGVTICYQILFTDIMDHLPQYAALKAIGYSNGFLIKVVLQEAFYLAVAAFLVGLPVSVGLYATVHAVSGLLLQLTPGRVLLVFVLTVPMCLLSGAIALRKVIRSDPAEVFA